jgi:glycosyltransferase involved in cell wall biosynthesis
MIRAVYICGDVVGGPGGAGQVTKHELLALKEVFGDDAVAVLQLADVRPVVYANLDVPYLWDYFALAQLHERRFDALEHAHIYSGCYSETVRYLKSRGVTVSYTCPAHARGPSLKERQLRGFGANLPHIDDDTLWAQHKQGLLDADVVNAGSTHSEAFLRTEGVSNMVRIPHGIEEIPEQVAPFPAEFTVGYLGASGPDKGIPYLIDAWAALGWDDARLVIAGEGSQHWGPFIQTRAGKGRFALLGYVPDVATFYNAITVYCQPSVSEGWGLEVVEAMSYGRPVVASTGAGASDAVSPDCGWRPPPGDSDSLAFCIRAAREHSSVYLQRMGNSGREKAKDYLWERIRKQYIQVFQELRDGRN